MFVMDPVEIAAFERQLEEGRLIAVARLEAEERQRQEAERKALEAKKNQSGNSPTS